MNGIFFYTGLGLGLAAACGVRPYLPALLAGALGSSSGALGVKFAHGHYRFLQSPAWLLAVAVVLALTYLVQLRVGTERLQAAAAPALSAQGIAVGGLLFGGTLAAHGDASWPGLLAGACVAALTQRVISPVLGGARARLNDRAAREALTLYADGASLALAALVALLHPVGYLAFAALPWLILRVRSRAGEKHAGLRIVRR